MRLDTKEKRLDARNYEIDNIIMKKDSAVKTLKHDLTILTYNSIVGGTLKPCLKIFRGTAASPVANYFYKTDEQRQVAIDGWVKSAENRIAAKEERQAQKKSFKPTLKCGDILYTSWGYDQTNVDFFQVIEAKGYFVTVQQLCQRRVEGTDGFMCADVMPIPDDFYSKDQLRKKVSEGNRIRISSCETAYPWNGKAKYTSHYA